MPELPEIELYKRYLDQTAHGKTITRIDFLHTGALQHPQKEFELALQGSKFVGSERLGKYLIAETSGSQDLVFHFGMTGKLEFFQHEQEPKYSRVIFHFKEGGAMSYVCRRKLGKLFLTANKETFRKGHDLGRDAMELTENDFIDLVRERKGSIKGVLTDQHILAGIGNVYSDEMLYHCQIHPRTKANDLSPEQLGALYRKMKEILQVAIDVDGERDAFPEDYLIKHRKEGADCPKCSGKVKQIKISGRSTYFCSSCQKAFS